MLLISDEVFRRTAVRAGFYWCHHRHHRS